MKQFAIGTMGEVPTSATRPQRPDHLTDESFRHPESDVTKRRMIEAAAVLADAHGLRQITLAGVARAAGITREDVRDHLGGADELLAGLATLALCELADRADAAVAGLSGREALDALAAVHLTYARQHPGLVEAVGPLDVPIGPALAAAAARIGGHIRAVVRSYGVHPRDEVHAVRHLVSVFRGFTQTEASRSFSLHRPSVDASWRWTLDALDTALRHQAPSAG
jgi:AcrR family transcriptional regulator